jgi:hypothetical protein
VLPGKKHPTAMPTSRSGCRRAAASTSTPSAPT